LGLVLCSLAIFSFATEGDPTQSILTVMLTAVAYSVVIAEDIPKLGYLTFLDKCEYGAFSLAGRRTCKPCAPGMPTCQGTYCTCCLATDKLPHRASPAWLPFVLDVLGLTTGFMMLLSSVMWANAVGDDYNIGDDYCCWAAL